MTKAADSSASDQPAESGVSSLQVKWGNDVHPWPNQQESKEAGCTCVWWGGGSIVTFDPDCPILDAHKRPNEDVA